MTIDGKINTRLFLQCPFKNVFDSELLGAVEFSQPPNYSAVPAIDFS